MTVSVARDGQPDGDVGASGAEGTTVDLASPQAVDAALRAGSTDLGVHAAALRIAHAAGVDPELSRSRVRWWVLAFSELMSDGDLDAAGYAVSLLNEAFPGRRYLENMEVVLHRLPPPVDNGREPFEDDPDSDVQLVRTPGAEAVVIDFCGAAHGPGLPIRVMDRWWSQLGAHVIYLRDRRKVGYTEGIPDLGASLTETIAGLSEIIKDLGVTRVGCVGSSAGGTGALLYGVGLRADRVLALAPITGGPKLDRTVDPPLPTDEPRGWGDLVPIYRDATGVRARIIYGEKNLADHIQAVRMAGLPGVTVEALADWEAHLLLVGLLRVDLLEDVLGWLVSPDDSIGNHHLMGTLSGVSPPDARRQATALGRRDR